MTTQLRTDLIYRLMEEDKDGLAYCFNHMKGHLRLSLGFWQEHTKGELREKLAHLTDAELEKLSTFKTYKGLFENKIYTTSDLVPGKMYRLKATSGIEVEAKCIRRGKFYVLFHTKGGQKIWMTNTLVHETVKPI